MNRTQLATPAPSSHLRHPHRRRRERGVQMIEVVLVMPLLLMLMASTAELGRYFYTYSVLARATRISARYLSGSLLNTANHTAAKNMAVCGLTTTCSIAVVPGLTTSNIAITPAANPTTWPSTVTVSITSYNYQPIFNLGNWTGVSWTSVAVKPSTTMRYLLNN